MPPKKSKPSGTSAKPSGTSAKPSGTSAKAKSPARKPAKKAAPKKSVNLAAKGDIVAKAEALIPAAAAAAAPVPANILPKLPSLPNVPAEHAAEPDSPVSSDSDEDQEDQKDSSGPKTVDGGAAEVHLESKSKYLKMCVCSTGRVEGLVVSVAFNAKGASCDMLAAMKCQGRCFPKGAEEAAVCYAIYENVKAVLIGNPRAYAKNKVSNITCGLLNGDFFINWHVKANFSAIGKTLKIVALLLTPAKYYSIYQRLVKSCGGNAHKDGFAAAANAIADSIKSGVNVAIVGKINIRDTKAAQQKLAEIGKAVDAKMSVESAGAGKKDAEYHEPDYTGTTEVKVNGWAGLVLQSFIADKLRGYPVILCDKVLRVGVPEAQFNTQKNKLARMADDYVKQKYGSLDNDLGRIFAFNCMSLGMVGASDASTMCKGIKGADVASKLKALLN